MFQLTLENERLNRELEIARRQASERASRYFKQKKIIYIELNSNFYYKNINIIYLQNKSVGKSITVKKTRRSWRDSESWKGYGKSGR